MSQAEWRGREQHIRQLLLVMNTPAGAMNGHDDSQASKIPEEKQKTKKVSWPAQTHLLQSHKTVKPIRFLAQGILIRHNKMLPFFKC